MRRPRAALLLGVLIFVYLFVASATLVIWQSRGVYLLVGDEPHYLVMAKALAENFSLDQAAAYISERANPVIFAQTMEPLDPSLSSPATQTFINQSGMFSVHAPGLGMLLALPFLIGGVLGAKVALIAVGAAVVAVAWFAVGAFTTVPWTRFAITAVTAIACPLLYSAGQVYPDVPAGVIVLLGLTWLLLINRPHPRWQHALIIGLLSYLPWLQLKYSAPAALLVAALAWAWWRTRRGVALGAIVALGISLGTLFAFNVRAYGSVTGAYVDGGLEASGTAAMVFFGLLVDQNQGLLMLNPVLWAGLAGVVVLYRRQRRFALTWLLVVASLLAPNAMHPNWYGGGSFIGRFALPASIAFIIPAAAGLAALAERRPRAFWVVVALGGLMQGIYWLWYALVSGIQPGLSSGLDLYNKPATTWLENYAVFGFPFERFLPALYNVDWAASFWPNFIWLAGGVALIWLCFRLSSSRNRQPRSLMVALAGFVGLVIAAGMLAQPGPRSTVVLAADLPSQTGSVEGSSRVAIYGVDKPAFIAVGPQVSLRQGPYEVSVRYRSSAPADLVIGRWELTDATTETVIRTQELRGTLGSSETAVDQFAYRTLTAQVLEVRVAWYGTGEMAVDSVAVRNAQ